MNRKNIKWVDIDDSSKKQEVKFTPLNESSKDEVKDNRDYAFMLKTMLESFLYLRNKAKQLVKESSSAEILKKASDIKDGDERMNHKFFKGGEVNRKRRGADEWREFERHVEIITQFMHIDETEMKHMLEAMKKSFIALAQLNPGEKELAWSIKKKDPIAALDAGFQKLSELDKIFADAGIDGLEPAIRASRFLDLLSPYFKQKEMVQGKRGNMIQGDKVKELPLKKADKNFEYDIATFIKMLETRKDRTLADRMTTGTIQDLKNILKGAIKDSIPECDEKMTNMVLEIFRKIVNQGGYTKNNSSVGKGEIALAMFFRDCRLPKTKGDIEMTSFDGEPSKKVEVKGADAGITDRTVLKARIKNMSYATANELIQGHESDIKNLLQKFENDNESKEAWKYIQGETSEISKDRLNQIYTSFEKIVDQYDSETANKDKTKNIEHLDDRKKHNAKRAKDKKEVEHTWTWKEGFLFFIMFGILSKSYFGSFDSMIILNTDDDLNKSVDDSELFRSKMIKISYPSTGKNWYVKGVKLLKGIPEYVNVVYENRSNDGTFKAKFK